MKRRKLTIAVLGIVILAAALCTGFIIANGIREEKSFFVDKDSRGQKPMKSHTLEKIKIDKFSEADISLNCSNFSIFPSDDYYLEYCLSGTFREPEYSVSNGKFQFREGNPRTKFQFNLLANPAEQEGPYYLNLYVPEKQYFEFLNLSVEDGNVSLEQTEAKKAALSLEYGNLELGSFTGESLTITSDSGNIAFDSLTCGQLDISAEYGNVTGESISISDRADLNLDSGILNLKHASFKDVEIISEYGEILLELADAVSDYNYDLEAEYGSIKLNGTDLKMNEDDTVVYQKRDDSKKKSIFISCESGDVSIDGRE